MRPLIAKIWESLGTLLGLALFVFVLVPAVVFAFIYSGPIPRFLYLWGLIAAYFLAFLAGASVLVLIIVAIAEFIGSQLRKQPKDEDQWVRPRKRE